MNTRTPLIRSLIVLTLAPAFSLAQQAATPSLYYPPPISTAQPNASASSSPPLRQTPQAPAPARSASTGASTPPPSLLPAAPAATPPSVPAVTRSSIPPATSVSVTGMQATSAAAANAATDPPARPSILRTSRPARAAAEKSSAWANRSDATVASGEDGRVIVVYGESVPKIACAPLRICSIELEAGEVVHKVDAGDTVRWSFSPSIVGTGARKTVHVIIKPSEYNIETNVKIATDRRMYEIDVFSVKSTKFVRRIAFHYPDTQADKWVAQRAAMEKEERLTTAEMSGPTSDRLHFGYKVEGDGNLKSIRVFDDSEKTFIQLGDFESSNREAPVLVLIGADGREQLVNYRLKNGYYIIDKVIDKAALIVGVGRSQQRITITRDPCRKRGWFGSCREG